MMASVRATMPGVRIVQFSDESSPHLDGADQIVRRPVDPMALLIAKHYRDCEGEWLFLDTDVVVQRDVRWVFDANWDLALACRMREDYTPQTRDLWRAMPYNCGVMFSRSPLVWADVVSRIETMPLDVQRFMGVQQAVCDVVASGLYRTEILPRSFNYSPHLEDEDVSDQAIVHYKGAGRKPWMLHRAVAA
jgi:hypothetical protein